MNSPSDDDMFSRYRTELVMDAEARARTFRKLQERVLRGEQPLPEIDALPPQTAALRGLWGLPAKWVVTIAGLGVLLAANVVLRGSPLTAAEEYPVLGALGSQSSAAERAASPEATAVAEELFSPGARSTVNAEGVLFAPPAQPAVAQGRSGSVVGPRSGGLVDELRGSASRVASGAEATDRAQAKSAAPNAYITSPGLNTEAAKRAADAAPTAAGQGFPLASALRAQEQTSPLSAAARAQSPSHQTAAARVQGSGSEQTASARAQPQSRQNAAARVEESRSQQTAPAGMAEIAALGQDIAASESAGESEADAVSLQPSAAASSTKPQKLAYASRKETQTLPQRSDKEIASETLSKEVQLLQAAQLALRAGDTQRSLALLAEHTWTYPRGHLAEARDVARILALCQAGNVAQSKLHAKRFLQQRPKSPYAVRVRAGCAALTNSTGPRSEPNP